MVQLLYKQLTGFQTYTGFFYCNNFFFFSSTNHKKFDCQNLASAVHLRHFQIPCPSRRNKRTITAFFRYPEIFFQEICCPGKTPAQTEPAYDEQLKKTLKASQRPARIHREAGGLPQCGEDEEITISHIASRGQTQAGVLGSAAPYQENSSLPCLS